MLHDLAGHSWPARRKGSDFALALVLYTFLALSAIVVARQPGSIATIWPANGAAIALIVSAPRDRQWQMVLAGAAGNLAANLLYGDTVALSLAFVPPNLLEVALGSYLVNRSGRADRFAIDHRSFLHVLTAGAIVPPVLGATVGAATLQGLGFARFTSVWQDWYIGAALGGVAMLPLMLAMRAASFRVVMVRFGHPAKLASLTIVAAATLVALRYLPYPFVTISLVLMVLAFTRPRVTTFAASAVLVTSLAIALGTGWYVPAVPNTQLGHTLVFASALLVIVPAQVVSVVVARQRALSEMLSAVGSRVDDIIVFADMSGAYRWVNRARELYWGQPKEQVLGRTWAQNMDARSYEEIVRPMFERARGGEVVKRLVEFDYPVRGRRSIDMLMQPAHDEEGQQIGVLYCGTDVTEIEISRRDFQRVAEELRSANRSLEQFVRISSHDLREPLNSIVQFCDLIQNHPGAQLDGDGQLYFQHVRNGASRMKQMLDDVQQFVRLERMGAVECESVDLDRLVEELRSALAARIAASGAELVVSPLGTVQAQWALVSIVLQNLLANAIKFVPPGRQPMVKVLATRHDGKVRVSVRDNGIGIEADRLAELGTPFLRLHSRRKFDGTGLGLAICKCIAEQLGGHIEIESEPGSGSCFSLVVDDTHSGYRQKLSSTA